MSIPIKMMMAAAGRSRVVDVSGNLYAWGEGSTGELGDGAKVDRSSPIQIGSLKSMFLKLSAISLSLATLD